MEHDTSRRALKLALIVALAVAAIDILIIIVQEFFSSTIFSLFQVILPLISLLIAVLIYRSTNDRNIRFLMKILSVGFITTALSCISWTIVPLIVENSFVQTEWFYYLTQIGWLFSYALIAYALITLKNSRQWIINEQIDRFTSIEAAIITFLFIMFVVLSLRPDNAHMIDIVILMAYVFIDLIILTMCIKLITMNLKLELKFIVVAITLFFAMNMLGDIAFEARWLFSLKYLFTVEIRHLTNFLYNSSALIMTASLFFYYLEPFKLWALDEVRKSLKDTQLFVDNLIGQYPEATCIFDREGKIVLMNDAFVDLFRINRNKINSNFDLFTHISTGNDERQNFLKCLDRINAGEIVITPKMLIPRHNAPAIYVYVKMFPTYASDGKISNNVLIIEDITERVKLEDDLFKAYNSLKEQYERKVDFTNALAHELRTPLTPIIGYTEIIKSETHDERHRKYLEIIERNALKQKEIVNRMLELASMDAGVTKVGKSEFDPAVPIGEIIDNYRVVNANIHAEIPSGLKIFTDPEILRNILDNLISNAVKYSESDSRIEVRIVADGNDLLFSVQDHGIGIKKEDIDRIFERFYLVDGDKDTRLTGRVGLGLPLVKGYVALLDGKVWLESEPGKGSTFYFTIPLKKLSPDE